MPTMADTIAATRNKAYGTLSEQVNLVASAYTAGDESLTLRLDIGGVTPGMTISCGLNVFVVIGVNAGTKTLTVKPGYSGAPLRDAAIGDWVIIRPRVTDWYLFTELNDAITRLSSPGVGLYQMGTIEFDPNVFDWNYVLPDSLDFNRITRARFYQPGHQNIWIDLPPSAWQLDPAMRIIQMHRPTPAGASVQFVYTAGFTAASLLTDDLVTDCGLPATAVDVPILDVMGSLSMTTETRRNQVQSQGDSRRAGEVLAGSNSQQSRYWDRMWQDRVNEELARLYQRTSLTVGSP